jgi:3-oxoacyl-[acyl-carrier-protein] synthase III
MQLFFSGNAQGALVSLALFSLTANRDLKSDSQVLSLILVGEKVLYSTFLCALQLPGM